MLLHPCAAVAALLTALRAAPALAQPPSASNAASAPVPTYRSAFEGYQRFSDQPVAPWKASNDRVAQIGGWKAYAREAAAAQRSTASAASPASAPAEGGHQGHHEHKKP